MLVVWFFGGVAALVIFTILIKYFKGQKQDFLDKDELEGLQAQKKAEDAALKASDVVDVIPQSHLESGSGSEFDVKILTRELRDCLRENQSLHEDLRRLKQQNKMLSSDIDDLEAKIKLNSWSDRDSQEKFVDDVARVNRKDSSKGV